jgi:hypothetical protein
VLNAGVWHRHGATRGHLKCSMQVSGIGSSSPCSCCWMHLHKCAPLAVVRSLESKAGNSGSPAASVTRARQISCQASGWLCWGGYVASMDVCKIQSICSIAANYISIRNIVVSNVCSGCLATCGECLHPPPHSAHAHPGSTLAPVEHRWRRAAPNVLHMVTQLINNSARSAASPSPPTAALPHAARPHKQ